MLFCNDAIAHPSHVQALDQNWLSTVYLLINDVIAMLAPLTVPFLSINNHENKDSSHHINIDDGECRRTVLWALNPQTPSLPR
jgi:hypothetical protein